MGNKYEAKYQKVFFFFPPPVLVLRSTSPVCPADKDLWKLGMERTYRIGVWAPAKARLSGVMQSLALWVFEL